jgi:hypothetical protein
MYTETPRTDYGGGDRTRIILLLLIVCGGARFEHGNRFVGSGFTWPPSSSGRHRVYIIHTFNIIYIIYILYWFFFFVEIMYDCKMCVWCP